jgi:hypothetical protein
MRRWLSCITTRLGTSSTLDKAIRCFTTHYFGKLSGNEQMVRYSRSAYGEALSGLQRTLNSFPDVTSSETLSAATLLCLYEVGNVYMITLDYYIGADFFRDSSSRLPSMTPG